MGLLTLIKRRRSFKEIKMARSFNQVILMGNLTRDPEVRTIPSGTTVCSFGIALNRSFKGADGNWQEATDFVEIVAWGPLGDRVAQYMTKGKQCLVNGSLRYSSWEKDGQKRNKLEVVAQDVTFLGGAGGGQGDNSGQPTTQPNSAKAPMGKKDDIVIEDIGDEPINLDDIPF